MPRKIPKAKFKKGEKVLVTGRDIEDVGIVEKVGYIAHPEYYGGKETDPETWSYMIKNAPESLEDVQGLWREKNIRKLKSIKKVL